MNRSTPRSVVAALAAAALVIGLVDPSVDAADTAERGNTERTRSVGLARPAERGNTERTRSVGLARPADPVVVSGGRVPGVRRWSPARLVAFRWSDDAWEQVPVQVDERARVSFRTIYGGRTNPGGYPIGNFSAAVYSDPDTHVGADPNPRIDADDEIVFMARDTGGIAPDGARRPAGTRRGAVHLRIRDPLDGGVGHLYLFRQRGALAPDAGRPYVGYDHVLVSGDYVDTYRFDDGPNPERSRVRTASYRLGFADRWIHDRLQLRTGTGADILERHTFMFVPGVCVRSEQTFADAEGALVANISGPVRAIRSYIGANSGPLTQRDTVMYADRYDVRTYLRTHAIPGGIDAYDYSRAAIGMEYRSNLVPEGVTIDGVPDPAHARQGPLRWEQVSGPQGTLSMVFVLDTTADLTNNGVYRLDDATPNDSDEKQCTGDDEALGLSGPATSPLPNTDPTRGPADRFVTQRIVYMGDPDATTAVAVRHRRHVLSPLRVSVVAD